MPTTDEVATSDFQLDLFAPATVSSLLERELWVRRQDRQADAIAAQFQGESAVLISLALALARLAAQRDARQIALEQMQ